jgi:hypothetical protein
VHDHECAESTVRSFDSFLSPRSRRHDAQTYQPNTRQGSNWSGIT